eukprot:CCRYP_007119-RA/>CCRYP_007119-RA protein AED:0.63 eAED:0.16 QI:0/0/0/0.5/1/1/2/0/878
MAHALITYEEAQKAVGTLPSLAPRPNAVNIRALSTLLEQRLEKFPCTQALEHGFVGMVMPEQIYALRCAIPWAEWPDPGNHPAAANTSVEQRNIKTIYDANRVVFDSQENVCRAINDALNNAIPNAFGKPIGNQMGQKVYTVRDNSRDIASNLRTKYGMSTPAKKRRNNVLLDAPWDPADPIKALFDRIEDCFIFAPICKPEFTMEQIIHKAIVAIQLTGLYETALHEWSGFTEANKTWQQLKLHFEEAYELRLASGQGTAGTHGYVNSATATDDNFIASIQESIVNFHMANNANYQSMQDILQAARAETASLRAELQSTQQSFANFASATPTAFVPPIPQYVPAPPPGQQFTPTPAMPYQQYQQGGRGTRSRSGKGRNNRNRRGQTPQYFNPTTPATTFNIPSTTLGVPPPAFQPSSTPPNPVKYYNNWNMCFSYTDDDDEATVIASNVSCQHKSDQLTASTTASSNDDHSVAPTNICLQALPRTVTQPTTTQHQHYAIFDSGATAHFLVNSAHVLNRHPALKPLSIRLRNGKHIVSTHTCNLDLPWLPHSITEAHIVPGLSHSSLISTRKFCDAGCHVTLDQHVCRIYYQGALVLTGTRDETTGLWKVPIHPHRPAHPGQQSKLDSPHEAPHITAPHTAMNMYTLPSKQQQLKYMHQAFFSPPIATLLKAINNNQLQGFPLMKADLLRKYLAPSPATSKGHMKRPLTGIRSTRPTLTGPNTPPVAPPSNVPDDTPPNEPMSAPHFIPPDITDTACNVFCFAALADKHHGTMYTNATGALPAVTLEGNQYYLVAYAYDPNYIYATPLRNLQDESIMTAFDYVFQDLKSKGYKPTFNVTDNQATTPIKAYLGTENCKWQFIKPNNHHVNAAEHAIQTF